jgi:hypothetical protein
LLVNSCSNNAVDNSDQQAHPEPVYHQLACGEVLTGSIDQHGEIDNATFELDAEQLASVTFLQIEGSEPGNINASVIWEEPSSSTTFYLQDRRKMLVRGKDTGTFRIEVLAALDGTGSYKIGFDCIFPPSPLDAVLVDGSVANGAIIDQVESDQFTFEGEANEVVTLTTFVDDLWAETMLYSPSQSLVSTLQFGGTMITTLPETGTYVIQVSSFHSPEAPIGSYWIGFLGWRDLASVDPTIPIDATLSCGTPLTGTIDAAGDIDHLLFFGHSEPIDITLSDSGFSVYAVLYIPNFSTGFLVFPLEMGTQRLLLEPEIGPFLIQIRATDLASTGSYTLSCSSTQQ